MTMHAKVSGAWKTVNVPSVRVSGAWKNVAAGWVRVGGAWKKFYDAVTILLTDQLVEASNTAPADATTIYELRNDGVARYAINGSYTPITGEWMAGGSAANYDCRVTLTSGTLTSGTIDTWLNLGTTRNWTVDFTGSLGSKTCTFTVEIRPAGGGTALDSASITLTATVE